MKHTQKYVKKGLLKKRIVPLDGKKVHLELFLIRDNKDVLPPKKLLPSKLIKIMKDEEEYITRTEWYNCIDEKEVKKLLKYKISEILKETFAKPLKSGSFYFKSTSPIFSIPG